jgi:hypothetical protein
MKYAQRINFNVMKTEEDFKKLTSHLLQYKEQIDELTTQNSTLLAERDLLLAETGILKDEVKTLNSKVELLTMQLGYKDEIIALHKIIEQERGN